MFGYPKDRFQATKSPAYINATQALARLLRLEGSDSADRAAAEVLSQAREKEAGTRLGGGDSPLRQSRAIGCCLHQLVDPGTPCDATCHPPVPGEDHVSAWNRDRKRVAIVSEPYNLKIGDLRQVVAACDKHDLDVRIDPGISWHFPGRTLALIYTRRKPWPKI